MELTEHNDLLNITSLSRIEDDQYMWLDKFTVKNLELIFPSTEDSVTLKSVVDQTLTPMGSRLISKWILNPLLDKKEIEFRQEFVSSFISDENVREYIVETMSDTLYLNAFDKFLEDPNISMNPLNIVAAYNKNSVLPLAIFYRNHGRHGSTRN